MWGGIIGPTQLAVFVGVSGLSPQFHSPLGFFDQQGVNYQLPRGPPPFVDSNLLPQNLVQER